MVVVSLVSSRIFDEVIGCFCDSPPQSPTFPEAGHTSLYDEDKVLCPLWETALLLQIQELYYIDTIFLTLEHHREVFIFLPYFI